MTFTWRRTGVLLELYVFRNDPDMAAKGGGGESSWTTARCKRHVAPVSEKPGCGTIRRTEADVGRTIKEVATVVRFPIPHPKALVSFFFWGGGV